MFLLHHLRMTSLTTDMFIPQDMTPEMINSFKFRKYPRKHTPKICTLKTDNIQDSHDYDMLFSLTFRYVLGKFCCMKLLIISTS